MNTGTNIQLVSYAKFAGLTITPTGTFYGITGDGANTPETIYKIDPSNGHLTLNTQPGTGTDGEALAYNTSDELLYQYSGGNIFQSIDPMTSAVVGIFLDYTVDDFAHSFYIENLTYYFLFTAGDTIYDLNMSGGSTVLAVDQESNGEGSQGILRPT